MATFAKKTFNSANYLNYRPTYTKLLYQIIYDYHKLGYETAVDLGCGPVYSSFYIALTAGHRDRGTV